MKNKATCCRGNTFANLRYTKGLITIIYEDLCNSITTTTTNNPVKNWAERAPGQGCGAGDCGAASPTTTSASQLIDRAVTENHLRSAEQSPTTADTEKRPP